MTRAILSIEDQWSIVPKDRLGTRPYACQGAYDVELWQFPPDPGGGSLLIKPFQSLAS
jgi:hypothetical protein